MHLNPLVSIISPCYNGENYVSRFLDSVLAQDYDNIELIVVNDGSTDNSQVILESYLSKFEKRNYKYVIISQENAGQSEAINKGLAVFKGDYMTWVDSDDALTPDSISKKVKFMEAYSQIGLSICKIKVVEFGSFKVIGEQRRIPPKGKDSFFFDLIAGNNVFYTPGGYMVRSSMFRDAMPTPLKIQSPREIGQNFQLLLPISFKYPIGYIDDYLFFYSVRKDSHSRIRHSFEEWNNVLDIADNVLNNIAYSLDTDSKTRSVVLNAINARTLRCKLNNLLTHKRKDYVDDYIQSLKLTGFYQRHDDLLVFKIRHSLLRYVISFFGSIKKIFCDLINF